VLLGEYIDEMFMAHNLPILADMHTFEKKRMLMQFIGLNDLLMHMVLD